MTKEAIRMTAEEFIEKYGNEVLELVNRTKKGAYETFEKIILEQTPTNSDLKKSVESAVNRINELAKTMDTNFADIAKNLKLSNMLGVFNSLIGAANLCATVAGFAIIYSEIQEISKKIGDVVETVLKEHDLETFYKYDNVIADYRNMLDKKKIGIQFDKDENYKLISNEIAVLKLFVKMFRQNITGNKDEVLCAIISLSSMLAITISNYDETYYYAHKEKQKWHSSHKDWIEIFDDLSRKDFIEMIQDFVFIEKGCSQYETELFVMGYLDNINGARQGICDKQKLIELNDTNDQYETLLKQINYDAYNDIMNVFNAEESPFKNELLNVVQSVGQQLEMVN